MSMDIEPGSELTVKQANWLRDRGRLGEATEILECTLPEGYDPETGTSGSGIVANTIAEAQGAAPQPAVPPGQQTGVGVSFEVPEDMEDSERGRSTVARRSGIDADALVGEDSDVELSDDLVDSDDEEVPPYSAWEKESLETELANRNEGRDEPIEVTGTGKDGNVLKKDLIAALEADDQE